MVVFTAIQSNLTKGFLWISMVQSYAVLYSLIQVTNRIQVSFKCKTIQGFFFKVSRVVSLTDILNK